MLYRSSMLAGFVLFLAAAVAKFPNVNPILAAISAAGCLLAILLDLYWQRRAAQRRALIARIKFETTCPACVAGDHETAELAGFHGRYACDCPCTNKHAW